MKKEFFKWGVIVGAQQMQKPEIVARIKAMEEIALEVPQKMREQEFGWRMEAYAELLAA
jgi:hypothetical protein